VSDVSEHLEGMADILQQLDSGSQVRIPEEFLLHFQAIVSERLWTETDKFCKARHDLSDAIALSGTSRPAEVPRLKSAFSYFRQVLERPSEKPTNDR
jgi:hypothetical protein